MKTTHKLTIGAVLSSVAIVAVNMAAPVHVGPPGAYPDPKLTPGLVATTDIIELKSTFFDTGTTTFNSAIVDHQVVWTEKKGLTYSQAHRLTTEAMKREVCMNYPENCKGPHEIDHFCPLALGCADNAQNLWAEPEHLIIGGFDYGFHTKDKLEAVLVIRMKAGLISPTDAQQCILKDWVACYKQYGAGSMNLGSDGYSKPFTDPDDE